MNRQSIGAVSVAGVGLRQYKRGDSPVPEQALLQQAIIDACDDAAFDPKDIDGFVSYGDDRNNEPVRLVPELGIKRLRWHSQMWGGGGGGMAVAFGLAASAITSGQANAVILFRALVQDVSGRMSAAIAEHHLNDHFIAAGIMAPAQICAIRARRMFEYHQVPQSVTEELVRASYYHAANNPEAVAYGQSFEVEDLRTSRWIAEPYRLFDCSRENDGAGALLMISTERAKDLKQPPVKLLNVANGTEAGWGDLIENEKEYTSAAFRPIVKDLFEETGFTPNDIDVVQLYENFGAQGLAALIDHGFCTYENVAEVIKFENLIAPTGSLPLNTAGGNFAQGFIHGIGLAVEAVRVLRGDSPNPVPNAQTCLMTGGPAAPTVSSAIFSTADFQL